MSKNHERSDGVKVAADVANAAESAGEVVRGRPGRRSTSERRFSYPSDARGRRRRGLVAFHPRTAAPAASPPAAPPPVATLCSSPSLTSRAGAWRAHRSRQDGQGEDPRSSMTTPTSAAHARRWSALFDAGQECPRTRRLWLRLHDPHHRWRELLGVTLWRLRPPERRPRTLLPRRRPRRALSAAHQRSGVVDVLAVAVSLKRRVFVGDRATTRQKQPSPRAGQGPGRGRPPR